MTSNVGSRFVTEYAASGEYEQMKAMVEEALRSTFRPEFLNRVDDTIVFHSLTLEQIGEIVGLQLAEIRERLAERAITLEVTPAATERLALEGFDPVFGARPLKRVLQRQVVDRVAKEIIEGRITDGGSVTIDVIAGEIAVVT
jgi:ATP-dependent Clp protease ATP-binding subunit ClpB